MTRKNYDIIFVTNLPSFYKLRLYSELAKRRKVFVVFTERLDESRNDDFVRGEYGFDYEDISRKSTLGKLFYIARFCACVRAEKIITGGWNLPSFWAFALMSAKSRNATVVESSIFESRTQAGIRSLLKRIFLSRNSVVYAPGHPHERLVRALGFKGRVVITMGVGLFNVVPSPEFKPAKEVKNFLYVGRFLEVKNLKFLIEVFNRMPDLNLNMVGFGSIEAQLKAAAGKNIKFIGAVDNKDLPAVYRANDVFILPSVSETWGLVVEEALNNGLPVLLSDKVGCKEDVGGIGVTSLEFNCNDAESLQTAVRKICDVDFYNELKKNACKIDFADIQQRQVSAYLD